MITCLHCNHVGEEKDFGKSYRPGQVKSNRTCHECRRKADKKYRENNRDKYNLRVKTKRVSTKIWAVEYKGGKCNHCDGVFHHSAFDFHHVDPETKESDLGLMMNLNIDKLKAELDKCILLCSNCHRVHHFEKGF